MAKNEDKRNSNDEASRVYKAASVHKRRADTEALPKAERVIAGKLEAEAKAEAEAEAENVAEQASGEGSDAQVDAAAETVALEPIGEESAEVAADEKGGTEDGAEAEPEDATATEEAAEGTTAQHAKPKKRRWMRVVGIVFGVVVAALLVAVGYIAGNRWVRFDDSADMQGRWFAYGTDVPIQFQNGSIVLNDETSYAYSIDPTAKTIAYTFGNLAGQGRYWFNAERDVLIITDGAHYTMWSTLLDDVSYDIARLFGKSELPTTDASIVLSRSVVQDPAASAASSANASASASAGADGAGASASAESADASASSSEASGEDSRDKSSDMLMVSDIMMEDPAKDPDEQSGQNDQNGTYGQNGQNGTYGQGQ